MKVGALKQHHSGIMVCTNVFRTSLYAVSQLQVGAERRVQVRHRVSERGWLDTAS